MGSLQLSSTLQNPLPRRLLQPVIPSPVFLCLLPRAETGQEMLNQLPLFR